MNRAVPYDGQFLHAVFLLVLGHGQAPAQETYHQGHDRDNRVERGPQLVGHRGKELGANFLVVGLEFFDFSDVSTDDENLSSIVNY